MNDKKLADAVVALGVIAKSGTDPNTPIYYFDSPYIDLGTADMAMSDWRVAGALMEKYGNGLSYVLCVDIWSVYEISEHGDEVTLAENESLPRAIIEACVEALT